MAKLTSNPAITTYWHWFAGVLRPAKYGLLAAALMASFSIMRPNYYRSEARILPVDAKSSGGALGNLASAAAAFGVAVGGDSGDANLVDILQSRWMRERLLEKTYRFWDRSWLLGAPRERNEPLLRYLKSRNLDVGVGQIGEVVGISRDMKTRVITLSAETTSPELSQAVIKECLALLETFVQQKGRTRGGAKATFAEARLVEARGELGQVEDAFRSFLEGNRNYLSSSDPSVRLRGMRMEAELKLHQQLVATLAMAREQSLMEEKNDIPILNILDGGHLPMEKSRPARSSAVIMAFLLVTGGTWFYFNRNWLRERFLDADAEG